MSQEWKPRAFMVTTSKLNLHHSHDRVVVMRLCDFSTQVLGVLMCDFLNNGRYNIFIAPPPFYVPDYGVWVRVMRLGYLEIRGWGTYVWNTRGYIWDMSVSTKQVYSMSICVFVLWLWILRLMLLRVLGYNMGLALVILKLGVIYMLLFVCGLWIKFIILSMVNRGSIYSIYSNLIYFML